MKSVLISIQPKWCGLIADGKKTVEVRKTAPKLKPPFKCYIYCTMPKTKDPHQVLEVHGADGKIRKANGKVIGEFVCNCIGDYWFSEYETDIEEYEDVQMSCLSAKEILDYGDDKTLYFWNISNLVIYDKPKELCKFRMPCKEFDKDSFQCCVCEYYYYESNESVGFYDECTCDGLKHITRPPQSWCYVEEQEGK